MKIRLFFFALLGLFLSALPLQADEDVPQTITFEASLGPVTFPHDKHGEYTNNGCIKCHHAKTVEKKRACRTCHKKKNEMIEGDPLSFYDVKMRFCRDCHRDKNAANQGLKTPVSCRDCHNVKAIKWSE